MSIDSKTLYGGRIERGVIKTVDDNMDCTIDSYDRYGLTVYAKMPYGRSVGDDVLFVMFDDGEAAIIMKQ